MFFWSEPSLLIGYYLDQDLKMLGLSFLLVFCALWTQTGSLFITICGLFEIIISYPLGLFVWHVILREPYATCNALLLLNISIRFYSHLPWLLSLTKIDLMYNGIFIILGSKWHPFYINDRFAWLLKLTRAIFAYQQLALMTYLSCAMLSSKLHCRMRRYQQRSRHALRGPTTVRRQRCWRQVSQHASAAASCVYAARHFNTFIFLQCKSFSCLLTIPRNRCRFCSLCGVADLGHCMLWLYCKCHDILWLYTRYHVATSSDNCSRKVHDQLVSMVYAFACIQLRTGYGLLCKKSKWPHTWCR